jgi:AraC-like DNA-binding protein
MSRRRPPKRKKRDSLVSWEHGPVTVERYHCQPGEARAVDRHYHEAVQIAISSTALAAYRVGGATHRVRPDALSVIGSGEVHETYELESIPEPVVYWITYLSPSAMSEIASDALTRGRTEVSLSATLLEDRRLLTLFTRFHASLAQGTTLERELRLLAAVQDLVVRFSRERGALRHFARSKQAVQRTCDYLRDNVRRNVSLAELAQVAGMSASHLCALFLRELGMPPHEFQLQVRVDAAKALLVGGSSLSDVAWETGFSHQSHFGRHFKRLVGVAPGRVMSAGKPRAS